MSKPQDETQGDVPDTTTTTHFTEKSLQNQQRENNQKSPSTELPIDHQQAINQLIHSTVPQQRHTFPHRQTIQISLRDSSSFTQQYRYPHH